MVSQITLSALKTKEEKLLKEEELKRKYKAFEASLSEDRSEILRLSKSFIIQEIKVPKEDRAYFETELAKLTERYSP